MKHPQRRPPVRKPILNAPETLPKFKSSINITPVLKVRPRLAMHLARPLLITLHLLFPLTTTSLLPPPPSKPSPSPSLFTSSPPLTPRVLITHSPLGPHWHQYLDALSPFLPNPPACAFFTHFYTTILANLSPGGPWTHLPEWPSFIIGYGSVRLDFHSSVGPVPWAVVRDFARMMEGHSRAGFSGKFRYVYVHVATGLAITVLLSVGAS